MRSVNRLLLLTCGLGGLVLVAPAGGRGDPPAPQGDDKVQVDTSTIVGERAGELIHPWVLAIAEGLAVGSMAQFIAPYPTLGEASKRAAGSHYTPKLFSPRTRTVVRLLQRLPWPG